MKTLADVPEAMLASFTLLGFAAAYVIWRVWIFWRDRYGRHDPSKRGEPADAVERRVLAERATADLQVRIPQQGRREACSRRSGGVR